MAEGDETEVVTGGMIGIIAGVIIGLVLVIAIAIVRRK